jgi:signal transduction histidine kinase
VDLHELASALARQFERAAEQKGLVLAVEGEPGAIAVTDPDLLALVLRNLIGNAIKYARTGAVRVAVEPRPGEGATAWAVSVADQGPGIGPEHLGRIFEAFRRGEVFGQEGVGLGLAIASQAAKLLGAELTVESQVGRGSTFRLSLGPGR